MQLEKPKLFTDAKVFMYTMFLFCLVIFTRLTYEYISYKEFIEKPFFFTYVEVLSSYQKTKNGRKYSVLKLKSDAGKVFFTTSYKDLNLTKKRLRVQIFPSSAISFGSFLGTFYVRSRIKSEKHIAKSFKDRSIKYISSQHKDIYMKSLYSAIFLATSLNSELRVQIGMLGISHLVALSGFHLGILWGLVYGLLLFVYRVFQQRWFPYRHALFDVGLVTMMILGYYLWFVGSPPSLLRSFVMLFFGWAILLMGIELLSFTFLTTIMLFILSIYPSLVVSIGFGLSLVGVFYIFLILQYSKNYKTITVSLWLIPLGIHILISPIIHSIFGVTTIYQLLSPLISLLFVPFYPISMIAHLFGYGDILDSYLLKLLALAKDSIDIVTPLWFGLLYGSVSLWSIWSKKAFILLIWLAFAFHVYLYHQYI